MMEVVKENYPEAHLFAVALAMNQCKQISIDWIAGTLMRWLPESECDF